MLVTQIQNHLSILIFLMLLPTHPTLPGREEGAGDRADQGEQQQHGQGEHSLSQMTRQPVASIPLILTHLIILTNTNLPTHPPQIQYQQTHTTIVTTQHLTPLPPQTQAQVDSIPSLLPTAHHPLTLLTTTHHNHHLDSPGPTGSLPCESFILIMLITESQQQTTSSSAPYCMGVD